MDSGPYGLTESTAVPPTNGDQPQFPESVVQERIDPDVWDGMYVVGDVHGCINELHALLDTLDPSEDDLFVFVGDLVRKGPDSEAVVDFVRSNANMRSIRGNNEEKLLRGECSEGLPESQLAYLMDLPLCISWNGDLVVHAGLDPRRPVEAQGVEALLTMRSIPPENGYDGPFWFEGYEGPPRVFFGHTVLDKPFVSPHAVGLDTGCVYGGSLTAYDYRADEFISVPAEREYRRRADAKIVEPD